MRSMIVLVSSLIVFAACASRSEGVRPIESKIIVKGNVGDAKLGLNEKNEAIVQLERQAQDELTIQEAVNLRLQDDLNHYEGELTECLRYRADERLGGNGVLPELPDVSSLKTPEVVEEEFGSAEDGSLRIVKKSYFLERLKNARSYEKSIRAMTKVLKAQNAQCQMSLELARNKAGLPGKKTMAEGYFTRSGQWVETRRGEGSVSDAFEIQAENSARVRPED